jgi:hypothetical protein
LRMAGIKDEHAVEAVSLSWLVMEISIALIDLWVLPFQDIPRLPKLAQEVLASVGLISESLREEHASGTGPWT